MRSLLSAGRPLLRLIRNLLQYILNQHLYALLAYQQHCPSQEIVIHKKEIVSTGISLMPYAFIVKDSIYHQIGKKK